MSPATLRPPRLFDDPRGVAPPPPATLDDIAERFLRGYTGTPQRGSEFIREDDVRVHELVTIPGACYAVAARGPRIDDLDLVVREVAVDGRERWRGEDLRRDGWPVVEWCAEMAQARVTVHAFDGSGTYELGLFVLPGSERAVRGPYEEPLLNRLLHAAGTVAPRAHPVSEPVRLEAAGPTVWTLPVELPPESCYVIVATGDGGVRELDLVVTAAGREIAADYRSGSDPAVRFCPATAGDPTEVVVGLVRGSGTVGVIALDAGTP